MKEKETVKVERLLKDFTKNEYLTAEKIAENLGVSVKTARTRLADLNVLIEDHGAEIVSRPRFGYHLQINDPDEWNLYLRSQSLQKEAETGTPQERTAFVALSLLTAADYLKIGYFADELFVSPQVISVTLKECENLFAYHQLSLERKPYYGLRLIGTEFDKRCCIAANYLNEFRDLEHVGPMFGELLKQAFRTAVAVFRSRHIHLTEISLQRTAAYAALSVSRWNTGFRIVSSKPVSDGTVSAPISAAAKEIFQDLCPEISEAETEHLALFISGMRSNVSWESYVNTEFDHRIVQMTDQIFDAVDQLYSVNFSNNHRLHRMLSRHLVSMDIRIRCRIPLSSEVYPNIQKDFPFSYAIANEAVSVLAKEYGTQIPAEEADWLALIFATGLQDLQDAQKMNVLVVSGSGSATCRLLEHQILKNYSDYIGSVQICTPYELADFDFTGIDYIFSTSNITIRTGLPVMMIDRMDLNRKNPAVENRLIRHRISALGRFFAKDCFFTDVSGSTKEEILQDFCRKIAEHRNLPEGFCEALLERERLHSTDFVPLAALPHPAELVPEENIVAVAVLKKPVFWVRNSVQILILTALSGNDEETAQQFYGMTSHFIRDRKNISALLKSPTHETLIGLLSQIDMK